MDSYLLLTKGERTYQKGKTWLIFPDLKECELAKKEWAGKRYQEATFTTIEAVTNFLGNSDRRRENDSKAGNGGVSYDAPWGSRWDSQLFPMHRSPVIFFRLNCAFLLLVA